MSIDADVHYVSHIYCLRHQDRLGPPHLSSIQHSFCDDVSTFTSAQPSSTSPSPRHTRKHFAAIVLPSSVAISPYVLSATLSLLLASSVFPHTFSFSHCPSPSLSRAR